MWCQIEIAMLSDCNDGGCAGTRDNLSDLTFKEQ